MPFVYILTMWEGGCKLQNGGCVTFCTFQESNQLKEDYNEKPTTYHTGNKEIFRVYRYDEYGKELYDNIRLTYV